ncbi:MAG: RDD family protein [bacterium]
MDCSEPTVNETTPTQTTQRVQQARSLIEFPGLTKSSVPQWRKELGERVREVQERKAREASLEVGETGQLVGEGESRTPLLELLPPVDAPPVNPLVAAALQRIERAHVQSRFSGNAAVATVLDYEEHSEFGLEVPALGDYADDSDVFREDPHHASNRPEKIHNLAVVPPQVQFVTSAIDPVDAPVVDDTEPPKPTIKPKRLILGDLNDPALNYLDSIPVTVWLDVAEKRSAPILFRFVSGIMDIVVVCLLSSPAVVLARMAGLKWQDSRTLLFAAGTFIVMGFVYLTISTAFTGRTLGMKLFSLRVVDARTGLIPTGGQSAARALVYMLTLASAGLALLYTFVDRERRTAHDHFTRTAVVRV